MKSKNILNNSTTHAHHQHNTTLLEFDYNLDLLHFRNYPNTVTGSGIGNNNSHHQQPAPPFVCDDISIILPAPVQNKMAAGGTHAGYQTNNIIGT